MQWQNGTNPDNHSADKEKGWSCYHIEEIKAVYIH